MCFVVTCWERADLLALVCGVYCEFVTFPLVSWVRCGTWLYRFLIFAHLLTSNRNWEICDRNIHWRERKMNKKDTDKQYVAVVLLHNTTFIGEKEKWTNKGTDNKYVAVFCYTIQLITIKLCTKFQNPKSSSCWKLFDRKKSKYSVKIFTGKKEKWTNKGTDKQYVAVFVTQYYPSLTSFVPNFRVLSQVVAEKSSQTDSQFTNRQTNRQTNIVTEKAILYTPYILRTGDIITHIYLEAC